MTSRRAFLAALVAPIAGRSLVQPWPQCAVCGRVRAMKIFAPDRPWIPPTYLPCQRCQSKQALAALYASGRSMFNPREDLAALWKANYFAPHLVRLQEQQNSQLTAECEVIEQRFAFASLYPPALVLKG